MMEPRYHPTFSYSQVDAFSLTDVLGCLDAESILVRGQEVVRHSIEKHEFSVLFNGNHRALFATDCSTELV